MSALYIFYDPNEMFKTHVNGLYPFNVAFTFGWNLGFHSTSAIQRHQKTVTHLYHIPNNLAGTAMIIHRTSPRKFVCIQFTEVDFLSLLV